jgi:hypothetical protein
VPAEQHEALYGHIGGLFKALLRHRGLRTNLARTYLCGSAELRDSYANNLDNFHALWESVGSRGYPTMPAGPTSCRAGTTR